MKVLIASCFLLTVVHAFRDHESIAQLRHEALKLNKSSCNIPCSIKERECVGQAKWHWHLSKGGKAFEPQLLNQDIEICKQSESMCHAKCEKGYQEERVMLDDYICITKCNYEHASCARKKNDWTEGGECDQYYSECTAACKAKMENATCLLKCELPFTKCFDSAQKEQKSVLIKSYKIGQCYANQTRCIIKSKCEAVDAAELKELQKERIDQEKEFDQDYRFCRVRCNATTVEECLSKKKISKAEKVECVKKSRCLVGCSKCLGGCESEFEKCFKFAPRKSTPALRHRERGYCYLTRASCIEKKCQ